MRGEEAGWTCATAHLRAAACLRIIVGNRICDSQTIEMIEALVDEAGPQFAAELEKAGEVPF